VAAEGEFGEHRVHVGRRAKVGHGFPTGCAPLELTRNDGGRDPAQVVEDFHASLIAALVVHIRRVHDRGQGAKRRRLFTSGQPLGATKIGCTKAADNTG